MNSKHSSSSPSLEQERNLLSQERTLLSSERTFLSWLRTGLTSIGIGIAIARLLLFENVQSAYLAHLVGQLLIVWGIAIFIFALGSYHRTYKKLYPLNKLSHYFTTVAFLTLALIVLSFILFWIII